MVDESNAEPVSDEDDEDLEVEMALLAMAQDVSGPTEDVDIRSLSPTERRALLRYLREHLGVGSENTPPDTEPR